GGGVLLPEPHAASARTYHLTAPIYHGAHGCRCFAAASIDLRCVSSRRRRALTHARSFALRIAASPLVTRSTASLMSLSLLRRSVSTISRRFEAASTSRCAASTLRWASSRSLTIASRCDGLSETPETSAAAGSGAFAGGAGGSSSLLSASPSWSS